ncbi:hypothetical protein [Methylomonas sp. MgM2]
MCLEITETKDFALTIAAFSSIYVGVSGLSAWKRQLRGNTEYTVAKNALTALYELREAIELARDRFQYCSPDLPLQEWEKLDDQKKQLLQMFENYKQRREKIANAEQKFKACLIEMEAVWGREPLEKIKPLSDLIKDLYFSISEHYLYMFKQTFNRASYNEDEFKEMKIHEKTAFKSFRGDSDEYMDKLESAISNIENILKPTIQEYHV